MAATWANATARGNIVESKGKYSGIDFRSWIDVVVNAGTATTYSITVKYGIMTSSAATGYVSNVGCSYILAATGQTTIRADDSWRYQNNESGNNTTATNKKQIGSVTWTWPRGTTDAPKTIELRTWNDYNSNCYWDVSTVRYTEVEVPALDRIGVIYHANGGSIAGGGRYKASDGKWYQLSGGTVQRSDTQTGTYSNYIQYFYYGGNGGNTVCNLTNPGTFGITRTGYDVPTATGYARDSATGTKLHLESATWSQLGGSNGSDHKTQTTTTRHVYANWVPKTYTITYNANAGGDNSVRNLPSATSAAYNTTYTISTAKATRTNYVCTGYNTETDGSGYSTSFTVKGATTLYAQWRATYKITYNLNGGTGTVSNQTKERGVAIKLSTVVPKKDFYTFAGWKLNNTGTVYGAGASFSANGTNAGDTLTLYAQWTPNKITINFYGGSDGTKSKTFTYNPSVQGITFAYSDISRATSSGGLDFYKTGYIFDHWNTTSGDTGTKYNDSSTVLDDFKWSGNFINSIKINSTSTKNLYSFWTPITYNLILNRNISEDSAYPSRILNKNTDPTIIDPDYDTKVKFEGLKYTELKALTQDRFSRQGYKITGWAEDPSSSEYDYYDGQLVSGLGKTQDEKVNLYAVWAPEIQTPYISSMSSDRSNNWGAEDTGKHAIITVIPVSGSYYEEAADKPEGTPTQEQIIDNATKSITPISFTLTTEATVSGQTQNQNLSITYGTTDPLDGNKIKKITDGYQLLVKNFDNPSADEIYNLNEVYNYSILMVCKDQKNPPTEYRFTDGSGVIEKAQFIIDIYTPAEGADTGVPRIGFGKSIDESKDTQAGAYFADNIFLVLDDDGADTVDKSIETLVNSLGWDIWIDNNSTNS